MKEYCGNCKHKENCKGARIDINDDFSWCWCYQKEQKYCKEMDIENEINRRLEEDNK